LEVAADIDCIIKIDLTLKSFIKPWEEQNPEQSFLEEMFINVYGDPSKDDIKFLSDPTDKAKPSFQKSLK
jgi:hypothetical protein